MTTLVVVMAAAGVLAWAWLGRPESDAEEAARHRRCCEAYRDNDPLL